MRSVVIVAGGSGTRMNSQIPKQFLEINGKPVLIWTIEKFIDFDPNMQIILVLPESHMIIWHDFLERFPHVSKAEIIAGGIARFDSVKNGLSLVKNSSIVGIHDAVRPLVSTETLDRCYNTAKKEGSAIPIIDTEDSLRELSSLGSSILDRSNIKRVQTPQVFKAEKIITAYENCLEQNYSDDASVYEAYFGQVSLVQGNKENLKLTVPSDIRLAEALLGKD